MGAPSSIANQKSEIQNPEDPHPNPPPAYRERGTGIREGASEKDAGVAVAEAQQQVKTINRDKVEGLRKSLVAGDVYTLSRAVEHCGGFAGQPFKGLLISTMQRGYDRARTARLSMVVKTLSEAEILWLCENAE